MITAVDGKKSFKKYTITDSQKSFIVLADSACELKNFLDSKKKSGQIQPFIAVIGSAENPEKILVYFDTIYYQFAHVAKALDVCFKIFQVFNIAYPSESKMVWTFVQQYLYNINLKSDEVYPAISLLISKLH